MPLFRGFSTLFFLSFITGFWTISQANKEMVPPPTLPPPKKRADIISPPPLASMGSARQHAIVTPNNRISLNFTNIKTRELLQVIAQFTGLNFVVSDAVKGNMSIHLINVPWQQALHVVLKAQGLGERRVGEIIYVAPIQDLARQDIEELRAKQQLQELEPLQNRIVKLRYADAEEITKLLTSKNGTIISPRGQVNFDKRTNSLWIRDTEYNLHEIIPLVYRLDHPAKQVVIQARIVSIERPYEEQLGARFGVTSPEHLSGTLEGANALAQGVPPQLVAIKDRLNFNVPATPIFGATPGTIGLAVAQLGNVFIDLELSALERQGHLQLISSPRLMTSNQRPAYIKVGEEIPYQTATASGATAIEFKDAVLQLEVTPQITSDNRILLNLKVSNNRAGIPVNLEGAGQAIPIETEEESSSILVNNHQTIVIGGVYKQNKQKIISRIPFLGTLPLVGRLFSHTQDKNDQSELLIFLTPHIIHKPSQLD